MRRREILALVALVVVAACDRRPRCKRCGMVLDSSSRWLAELHGATEIDRFDTPKCAFAAWRSGRPPGTRARFRGYYTQRDYDSSELVFAVGGDVLGPMGPDLVPIEPEHGEKFVRDHGARLVGAAEVTLGLAEDPR